MKVSGVFLRFWRRVMDAFMFGKALESAAKERALTEGFRAIVRAYYEEYEDAEELDGSFESSLRAVFDVCFPAGEDAEGREFDEIIKK